MTKILIEEHVVKLALEALEKMMEEFRGYDLPYGSKAYALAKDARLILIESLQQPQQRKPLTDEQIKQAWYEACKTDLELTSQLVVWFARAIEAAHGIYAPTELKGEAT